MTQVNANFHFQVLNHKAFSKVRNSTETLLEKYLQSSVVLRFSLLAADSYSRCIGLSYPPHKPSSSPRNGNLHRKGKAQISRPKIQALRGMDAASVEGTFLNSQHGLL